MAGIACTAVHMSTCKDRQARRQTLRVGRQAGICKHGTGLTIPRDTMPPQTRRATPHIQFAHMPAILPSYQAHEMPCSLNT
jgi:hypothetical protein